MTLAANLSREYDIASLPEWKRREAELLIANCLRDLTWWPGLAGDIIADVRSALAALRDTEDVIA